MNVAGKFQEFETSYDLSVFSWDGFWYYPVIKTMIYFELARKNGQRKTSKKKQSSQISQIWVQFLQGVRWRQKSSTLKPVHYLFVDYAHTRRQGSTGYFENMYTEPIIKSCIDGTYLLIEYPNDAFGHYHKQNYDNIYFLDWELFKIYIRAKLKRKKYVKENSPIKKLFDTFDLTFKPSIINDRLTKMFLFVKFFVRLLKKIHPEVILLIDGYDYKQMALISAANELRIPTIELQHGLISPSHMGYIYKKVHERRLFADFLFTFGDYFSELIKNHSKAWKSQNIISVGFPYIEMVKKHSAELPEKLKELAASHRIIYVTSQWTVRKELLKFILQLSELIEERYFIFYKTHPGEKNVREFYEPLKKKKNVELITDKTVNSLEIMKVAKVHSTVYSTSYFESTYFELANIFIYVDQYSHLVEKFVDNETAFFAKTPQEYLSFLIRLENDAYLLSKLENKRSLFYRPNAFENIKQALKKIKREAS